MVFWSLQLAPRALVGTELPALKAALLRAVGRTQMLPSAQSSRAARARSASVVASSSCTTSRAKTWPVTSSLEVSRFHCQQQRAPPPGAPSAASVPACSVSTPA